MDHFQLRDGVLHAEDVPLPRIAEEVGTPVYVYSRATLERHARVFREALSGLDDPHIAFAVKANPNLAVLKILANEGYGADVVSGGEYSRALAAGEGGPSELPQRFATRARKRRASFRLGCWRWLVCRSLSLSLCFSFSSFSSSSDF